MSSGARLVLAVLLGVFLLVVASVGLAVAAVFHDGTVRVAVEEHGHSGDRISVVVPASLIHLAVALAPHDVLDDIPEEARPWIRALAQAGEELVHCPDTVFVEVRNPYESVVVEKRGSKFYVRVENEHESIRVVFSESTLRAVLRGIDRMV